MHTCLASIYVITKQAGLLVDTGLDKMIENLKATINIKSKNWIDPNVAYIQQITIILWEIWQHDSKWIAMQDN